MFSLSLLSVSSQFSLWIIKFNSVGFVHVACVWHTFKKKAKWQLNIRPDALPDTTKACIFSINNSFTRVADSEIVFFHVCFLLLLKRDSTTVFDITRSVTMTTISPRLFCYVLKPFAQHSLRLNSRHSVCSSTQVFIN